jgi:hypothetical protein
MGSKKRKHTKPAAAPKLPTVRRGNDDGSMELELRCSMTPRTRQVYAETVGGEIGQAAMTREDSWHRAVEFLFERLVVGWTANGVPTTGQKALIARFRVADQAERAWIRTALRAHLAEWFPEMQAP